MIIHGNYIGSPIAQPNWNQTDVTKPDYILGKEELDAKIDEKQKQHKTATVQLLSGSWVNNNQVVTVEGASASTTLLVVSAPENYDAYAKAGVYCSAQADNKLTFTCKSVPAVNLTANIMLLD